MPKVSIVILNFNGGHSVVESIESVLRQTYTDWELIVTADRDDPSADASRELLLDRIQRERCLHASVIAVPDKPIGIPTLMNLAEERSAGEYVAWLTPQTIWEPAWIEEHVRVLDADPAAAMVHSASGVIHDPVASADVFTTLIARNYIDINTVLVRRSVLAQLGPFTETMPNALGHARASAYYHWLRMAVRHPVRYIPQVLTHVQTPAERDADVSLESSLERFFIRGCFEREKPRITPEIVCALGRRGAMSTFLEAFGQLSDEGRVEALRLLRQSGLDAAWMARHSGESVADPGRVTDGMLRHRVMGQVDGLKDALNRDRLSAARLLLDWSSNAANFAIGSALSQATMATLKTASVAETYFEQFLPNRGAVYCGGMSVFFDRVLKAFGMDCFTVNFGDLRDDLNHVCVNLPEWDGSAWHHYLFDPTFNAAFHCRSTGRQLDFFELVDALDREDFDVTVVAGSLEPRDWVSTSPLSNSTFALRDVAGGNFVYGRQDGTLEDYVDRNDRGLRANGYASGVRGLVELMRARMFSIGSCAEKAASADFKLKLSARGIPFGKPQ